jgi:hypothetical protein
MTYYDWQITHSEVMSWDSRHAVIPIHQRDSRVGYVRIHRILVELRHLTELELRK